MNVRAQSFQAFFVAYTKVLLFVDNQQAKIIKLGVFRQQSMGPDDNINNASRHVLTGFFRTFCSNEARQRAHFDREPAKPFCKALVVLTRKQRRRRNDGHLHT